MPIFGLSRREIAAADFLAVQGEYHGVLQLESPEAEPVARYALDVAIVVDMTLVAEYEGNLLSCLVEQDVDISFEDVVHVETGTLQFFHVGPGLFARTE